MRRERRGGERRGGERRGGREERGERGEKRREIVEERDCDNLSV